jgi:hypothetical protein
MIKPCGELALFTNSSANSISASQANVMSQAERFCASLRTAVETISLRFYFSSLGITAILANKRIDRALFFLFVEATESQKKFAHCENCFSTSETDVLA